MVNDPSMWISRRLDELLSDVVTGGTPTTSNPYFWDGEIPWLASTEIHQGRITNPTRNISISGLENSSARIAPAHSVLIALAGQGKTRGTAAILASPMALNQSLAALVPDPTLIDAEFLFYAMSYRYDSLRKVSSGDGSRGGLNKSLLRGFRLTLPQSTIEQQAIADVLSGFDEHLANLDTLIAKKKAIRDGALEDLVAGLRRLDGFTSRWKSVKLSQLVTLRNEISWTTPVIDIELENIVSGEGRITGDTTPRTSSLFCFRKGDVLFGRLRPYLKKFLLANCDGVRSGEIWALSASELIHPEFLFQLVRTRKFLSAANRTTGTKMPRADWNLLKEDTFLVPPLNEQATIASLLSSMDAEIAKLVEERTKVERLKQGAMEDLLTGHVRLPVHKEAS